MFERCVSYRGTGKTVKKHPQRVLSDFSIIEIDMYVQQKPLPICYIVFEVGTLTKKIAVKFLTVKLVVNRWNTGGKSCDQGPGWLFNHQNLFLRATKTFKYANKESVHPPGNGFPRALESRFLVHKSEVFLIPFHRPFFSRYGQFNLKYPKLR